jgi:hypothetical protein
MLITHWLTAESIVDPLRRESSALTTSDGSPNATVPSRRQTLDFGTRGADFLATLGEKPAPLSNTRLKDDSNSLHPTLR